MAKKHIYRINFLNAAQLYEIYAKKILTSDLLGFIEAEEFIFDTKSKVVVDPSEEKLKNEFAGVKRTFIPIQSIVRIDEVDKEGVAKIHESKDAKSTVTQFPSALYQSPNKPKAGD